MQIWTTLILMQPPFESDHNASTATDTHRIIYAFTKSPGGPDSSKATPPNGSSAKSGAVCRGEEGKFAGGERFLPLCLRSDRQPPR